MSLKTDLWKLQYCGVLKVYEPYIDEVSSATQKIKFTWSEETMKTTLEEAAVVLNRMFIFMKTL